MTDGLISAAILGIIEGLTEFIPVSSTGHLIVGGEILGRTSENGHVFDIFIQTGAILAVIWVHRLRVLSLAIGFFTNTHERLMGLKIIAAFIPAAIAGVLLHGFIKATLFNPWVVAIALILGGFAMLAIERRAPTPTATTMDGISMKTAFGIGLCQLAALIPGVSRAGATLVGAQFLGVERKAATEFSFFLAIPTIIGASAYDFYKNLDHLSSNDIPVFAIGTITAFISGLIVVRGLVAYVGKYGFTPFAYYRIVFGALVLTLLTTGII